MSAPAFDAVLEFALLGLFVGVCGYAARLVLTTVRGDHLRRPESPAPRDEAPGSD